MLSEWPFAFHEIGLKYLGQTPALVWPTGQRCPVKKVEQQIKYTCSDGPINCSFLFFISIFYFYWFHDGNINSSIQPVLKNTITFVMKRCWTFLPDQFLGRYFCTANGRITVIKMISHYSYAASNNLCYAVNISKPSQHICTDNCRTPIDTLTILIHEKCVIKTMFLWRTSGWELFQSRAIQCS